MYRKYVGKYVDIYLSIYLSIHLYADKAGEDIPSIIESPDHGMNL